MCSLASPSWHESADFPIFSPRLGQCKLDPRTLVNFCLTFIEPVMFAAKYSHKYQFYTYIYNLPNSSSLRLLNQQLSEAFIFQLLKYYTTLI